MVRKKPIRHTVRRHRRMGKTIEPFTRGTRSTPTRTPRKTSPTLVQTDYAKCVPLTGRYDQPIPIVPPPLEPGKSWEQELNGVRFKYTVTDDGLNVRFDSPLGPKYYNVELYLDEEQKKQLRIHLITKDMKYWQDRWFEGGVSSDSAKERIGRGRQRIRELM